MISDARGFPDTTAGVPTRRVNDLATGGDRAVSVFWDLYEDLESHALAFLGREFHASDVERERLVIDVIERCEGLAREGKLRQVLIPGDPDASPALTRKFLRQRLTDHVRRRRFRERFRPFTDFASDADGNDPLRVHAFRDGVSRLVPHDVNGDREVHRIPYPLDGSDHFTRAHDLLLVQHANRIVWNGTPEEETAQGRVCNWLGVHRWGDAEERLHAAHSEASLAHDAKIEDLIGNGLDQLTPHQRQHRVEQVRKTELAALTEPLSAPRLQNLLGISADSAHQNLKRYRELLSNDVGLQRRLFDGLCQDDGIRT